MTSILETPEGRNHSCEVRLSSDIQGGVVLDLCEGRSMETMALVYLSTEDILALLAWVNENKDEMVQKKKHAFTYGEE